MTRSISNSAANHIARNVEAEKMNDEQVERVAKAIAKWFACPWTFLLDAQREGYRSEARAAIAAMQPDDEHFDDEAVREFSKMMADKMRASREKGRSGWQDPEQCSVEYLRTLLYKHLAKGDPVDVANICMMLRHYRASTAMQPEPWESTVDELLPRNAEAIQPDAQAVRVKPLVWKDKVVREAKDGIAIHVGPYAVRLWNGKLGARIDYLGHPLEVFPNANGITTEVKEAVQRHHEANILAAIEPATDAQDIRNAALREAVDLLYARLAERKASVSGTRRAGTGHHEFMACINTLKALIKENTDGQ